MSAKDPYLPDPPAGYKRDPEKDWRPARGYRWEQFTGPSGSNPGWLPSLKHGVQSEHVLSALAEETAALMVVEAPELGAPRFRFALAGWAYSEAVAAVIRFNLSLKIAEGEDPRDDWLQWLARHERLALEHRRELGLTPASYARLQRDISEVAKSTFDLEKARAEGRKVREAAEERFERQRIERQSTATPDEQPDPADSNEGDEA